MANPYDNPQARTPLMTGNLARALQAYFGGDEDKPSVYSLWLHLPMAEQELRRLSNKVDLKYTCKMLSSPNHDLLHLMWAIPPPMMRALLRQTVGFEFNRKDPAIRAVSDAPGVYVTIIEPDGRRGKFMTRRETARAVRTIETYATLAPHFNRFHSNNPGFDLRYKLAKVPDAVIESGFDLAAFLQDFGIYFEVPDEPDKQCSEPYFVVDTASESTRKCIQEAATFIWSVDNATYLRMRGHGIWETHNRGCRLLPWDEAPGHAKGRLHRLGEMLKRRLGATVDDVLSSSDAQVDVNMEQTPQYVGCANSLLDRMKVYSMSRDIRYINAHIRILACVMSHMNIDLEIKARVVLRTWTAEQLPVAERLVMVLARSLVWQDGFNSEEGGGNRCISTRGTLNAAREFVQGKNDTYKKAVAMTEDEVDQYIEAAREAEQGVQLFDGLAEGVDTAEETLDRQRVDASILGKDIDEGLSLLEKALDLDLKIVEESISPLREIKKILS